MRIVITDGYELNPGDLDWTNIERLGILDYYDRSPAEKIVERCSSAEIIITNKTLINSSVISASSGLRLISVTATGYNNVDLNAATQAGVIVCNVPEYGTFSVAQHTFALLLESVNHVGLNAESVNKGEWETSGRWCYSKKPTAELKDKTLGIVGFGKIGKQVAEIARAFGMKIIFSNRSQKSSVIAEQVSFEELLRRSDVVSLHCPLTPENIGLVNRDCFSLMKSSAILINTSRGQLVNEPDLAHALRHRLLAGAALDVLSAEPPVGGNPLIGLDNCIITPHNAWLSVEARSRIMKVTYENICKYLDGDPQNQVNKQTSVS
jgi:glycerate dehydrogenase